MKWNVILQNPPSERLGVFNVFDHSSFQMEVNELFQKGYTKEKFTDELDLIAHYHFCAKVEWESIFTTWPPYIDMEELKRIIDTYHINRKPEESLPERVNVMPDRFRKIDVYDQLRVNWKRFVDYVWKEGQNADQKENG